MRARGRCATCYAYFRRNGRDRGERLVIRLTSRDISSVVERRTGADRYEVVDGHWLFRKRVDRRAEEAYAERRERLRREVSP